MTVEILTRLTEKSAKGIAEAVSQAIREGAYAEGEQLPTVRDVARDLLVSTSTVSSAWARLGRAGIVHADRRRGTIVSHRPTFSPERTRRTLINATKFEIDLSTGLPDPNLLPSLLPGVGRLDVNHRPPTYLEQPVIPELLARLHESWPHPVEEIMVLDGAHDALDLLISTKLRFGDRVAVERFSDANLLDLLEVAGTRIIPIDMDDKGILPGSLEYVIAEGASLIFAQPRGQHPTGVSWDSERAAELGSVMHAHPEATLVELDAEGSVAAPSISTVGVHVPNQVIHIRAYSSSHGPELRIAALGGPARLINDLLERRELGQGWTSRILQGVLFDLLADASTASIVADARAEYARRREQFIAELSQLGVHGEGPDGFFVRIRVPNETAVLTSLASQGIAVAPGAPHAVDSRDSSHIVVTTAVLRPDQSATVAEAIANAAFPRRRRTRMV